MSNKLFFTFLALWIGTQLSAQGWMQYYNTDFNRKKLPYYSTPTLDHGHALVTIVEGSQEQIKVTKTDSLGNEEWTYIAIAHPTPDVKPRGIAQLASDSSLIVTYDSVNVEMLLRLSPQGTEMYRVPISGGIQRRERNYRIGSLVTSDAHVLTLNTTWATPVPLGMIVSKFDLQGNLKWSRLYDSDTTKVPMPTQAVEATDGSYFLVGELEYDPDLLTTYREVQVFKVDTSGTVLWKRSHLSSAPTYETQLVATPNGGYTIAIGDSNLLSSPQMLLIHVDGQGNEVWRQASEPSLTGSPSPIMGLIAEPDGTYSIFANYFWQSYSFYVIRHSSTGQLIQVDTFQTPRRGLGVPESIHRVGNAYRFCGTVDDGVANTYSFFLLQTESARALPPNRIVGAIYDDVNLNCQRDSGEIAFSYVPLTIQGPSGTLLYATTNANGDYDVYVNTGQYIVTPTNVTPYRQFCKSQDTVFFFSNFNVDTVNFGAQTLDSCAYMEVDISAPFLRRCFNSVYYVSFYNRGTKEAQNAYIDVNLDPYINYVASSRPFSSQTGNVYRFNLGTVPALAQGQFTITVYIDCDSTALGQVHCTDAQIYPDFFCSDPWAGPQIELSSHCNGDTVVFELLNAGGAMSIPRQYTIIEEHVMLYSSPFQLGAGGQHSVRVPANRGLLYRIEAEQDPAFPTHRGGPIAVLNHWNCDSIPAPLQTPDILDEYYNGGGEPFFAIDCQPNIGAFDPNDKQAQPRGYDPAHYIRNNTPLHYHIRFQNTGTDTAFTVVILDTLDRDLNPSSIVMGASSHPYTWDLTENGTLEVRFDNILLPDSNVNEPASHGFVKFQIQQDPNLPDGTQLTNRAAIYFDFNAPIITNEVFHTIGSNFMEVRVVGIDQPLLEGIELQLYPNPFSHQATLEVQGATYDRLEVEVYNSMGQRLHIYQGSGSQLTLERQDLPSGVYLYRLIGDGQLLNTGKMMLK